MCVHNLFWQLVILGNSVKKCFHKAKCHCQSLKIRTFQYFEMCPESGDNYKRPQLSQLWGTGETLPKDHTEIVLRWHVLHKHDGTRHCKGNSDPQTIYQFKLFTYNT